MPETCPRAFARALGLLADRASLRNSQGSPQKGFFPNPGRDKIIHSGDVDLVMKQNKKYNHLLIEGLLLFKTSRMDVPNISGFAWHALLESILYKILTHYYSLYLAFITTNTQRLFFSILILVGCGKKQLKSHEQPQCNLLPRTHMPRNTQLLWSKVCTRTTGSSAQLHMHSRKVNCVYWPFSMVLFQQKAKQWQAILILNNAEFNTV